MRNTHLAKLLPLTASALTLAGTASLAQAEVTGNVGVVSQYIFRGGAEDGRTALQGGLDYAHDSGFYAGSWFSTLDYGATNNNEVDFYTGFAGEAGPVGYDLGLLYFLYTGDGPTDNDSNVPEAYGAVSYGPVGLSANVAIDDASWTAAGDTYLKVSFEQPLPDDFTFSANAGYYLYADDTVLDNDTVVIAKTQDSAFRDATISVSHPLAATGADVSFNYTFGGEFRDESEIDDHFWAGATFSF
jgi:uncharacterized protein (TIGR02001 family)